MSFRSLTYIAPAAFLLVACSGPVDSSEPSGSVNEGIVRGDEDPGHAAVFALDIPNNDGTETFCTATLYAPRTLVTAAHCVQDAAAILAYYGNDFWGDYEQTWNDPAEWQNWRLATDWQVHPKYSATTLNADIAIVHLDRDVPLKPIPIEARAIGNKDLGAKVDIVGYGAAGVDDTGAPVDALVKRNGFSKYVGSPPARPLPPNPHPGLGDRKIREQLMQLNGAAPLANMCFGDSGGPALMGAPGKEKLVGVASWTGDNCEEFSYYVRVHDFLPFLVKGALKAK